MAIPTITPYSGGVANPDGSQTQTEFTQNMFEQLSYEAQLSSELNATVNATNTTASDIASKVSVAQNSADTAQAAANFEGVFTVGVTSAVKGKSYSYNGNVWLCLQNTTSTPSTSNAAWKLSVGEQYVTDAQEDLLPPGSSLFKGDDGVYLKNGDTVPAGVTHLRVLVGGNPTIVAMSPIASGVVASLTETSATIGGVVVNFNQIGVTEYASVADLISGYPITAKEGYKVSTGVTTWKIISGSNGNGILLNNGLVAIALNGVWVDDYGAVGDGVNIDQDVIQDAIDGLLNGGTVVFGSNKVYLLSSDPDGLVITKSNVTLNLNNSTIIKGTNNYPHYNIVYFNDVDDCTIKNGKVVGDRYTHDYSSGGTHEGGLGIYLRNSSNCRIKNVKVSECTGDSITIGNQRDEYYQNISVSDGGIAQGGIDPDGTINLSLPGYYTTTNFNMTLPNLEYYHFWARYFGRNYGNALNRIRVFFYNSGTFISYVDYLQSHHEAKTSDIPVGANEAKIYLMDITDAPPASAKLDFGGGRFGCKNITVEDCELFDSRRQGITIGGARHVSITRCDIHHISGTPPQSGIDIEEGVNDFISIDKCRFWANKANMQSPSGMFTSIKDTYFGSAENSSMYSSNTGSIHAENCVFIGHNVYFDGRSVVDNCRFESLLLSDLSTTPDSFNKKYFKNCYLKEVQGGNFRATEIGDIVVSDTVLDNSSIADNKFTIKERIKYTHPVSNILGRFYDTNIVSSVDSTFNIASGSLLSAVKITPEAPETANKSFNILSDVSILNGSYIETDTGGFLSKIAVSDNVNVVNSTIHVKSPLAYQANVVRVVGSGVEFKDSKLSHDGAWSANNTAIIGLATSGKTIISRCELVTTSEDASALPSVYRETANAPYDMSFTLNDKCVEPVSDGNNRLSFNANVS